MTRLRSLLALSGLFLLMALHPLSMSAQLPTIDTSIASADSLPTLELATVTANDALGQVSTYVFAVLIFGLTFLSRFVPVIQDVPRKWLVAVATACAIGYVGIKFGYSSVDSSLWAFVLSGGIHELQQLWAWVREKLLGDAQ
jgi:hypothetical protein